MGGPIDEVNGQLKLLIPMVQDTQQDVIKVGNRVSVIETKIDALTKRGEHESRVLGSGSDRFHEIDLRMQQTDIETSARFKVAEEEIRKIKGVRKHWAGKVWQVVLMILSAILAAIISRYITTEKEKPNGPEIKSPNR